MNDVDFDDYADVVGCGRLHAFERSLLSPENEMYRHCLILAALSIMPIGCFQLPSDSFSQQRPSFNNGAQQEKETVQDKEKSANKEDGNEKEKTKDKEKPPAKTLFEWQIGKSSEEPEKDNKSEAPKPIDTDRPDFGAATTTVGKGRAVLETGYTIYHSKNEGEHFNGSTYPDSVLRLGLFAEWFEFRIGQTFANFKKTPASTPDNESPEPFRQNGAQDTYLGVKLALTEQKTFLPETVIIIQSTVPSGSRDLTSGQVLPGLIYLFSWETPDEKIFLSGLIEADKVVDSSAHSYVQMAQTFEVRYSVTSKLRTFVEWVALYPTNAVDPNVGPQYYIHPGIAYLLTDNIQLDAHLYIGLNKHSTDFYGGPGLSIRY